MKPLSIMLIAGETSGDMLAAELVVALRQQLTAAQTVYTPAMQPLVTGLEPHFFGAGGARMAAAGVDLAFDLTQHSVIGVSDVLKHLLKFRRLFHQLLDLAFERRPDVIIGVDYGGFNLRFGEAIKKHVRANRGVFNNWNPKLVQFVSPQVWASRAGRALKLERDYDLLLSIFPFEKAWYAQRVPKLHVEFVGHPMIGRFVNDGLQSTRGTAGDASIANRKPQILLLPGSRVSELKRHLPVMLEALKKIQANLPDVRARLVLPGETLKHLAQSLGTPAGVSIQIGNLPQALAESDVAIASTGTVTMECAYFGVPTVTLYKTSWLTYQIARRIIQVNSLTMPNLLAGETVFPEFVQHEATGEHISRAALELLQNESRRQQIKLRLAEIIASLGGPGAAERGASAIAGLLHSAA